MSDAVSVMVVDDEAIVGKRLAPSLRTRGYEVEVFGDGEEAIERLAQRAFDVVVTDIRMARVDGMQLLEHVVSHEMPSKVILITGYATVELAREALTRGAFDFIAKPFKPADLRAVIERAVDAISAATAPDAEPG